VKKKHTNVEGMGLLGKRHTSKKPLGSKEKLGYLRKQNSCRHEAGKKSKKMGKETMGQKSEKGCPKCEKMS